jgi:hypothetical protein
VKAVQAQPQWPPESRGGEVTAGSRALNNRWR